MARTAGEAFDLTARDYDRARRQLVPCFDDFYRGAIEMIALPSDAAVEVLDLGAGTGLMSALVASAFPAARLTLVDAAPEMLSRASERLSSLRGRIRMVVADYAREPIEGRYDAVVSALSIHHLPDEAKRTLFERVYKAISPGGVFVNAEQVRGPTLEAERRNRDKWLREVRERGVTSTDLEAALERMKHDLPATLEDQLDWLGKAGFRDADCVYKNGMFAVFGGYK
jgi:tRNA (cmo5U34)-methyltransferase